MSAHPPLSIEPKPHARPLTPSRTGLVAIYLFSLSVAVIALTSDDAQDQLPLLTTLVAFHLALYTLFFVVRPLPGWLLHLYFAGQSALIIWTLSIDSEIDIFTSFFIPLSFQVGLSFAGLQLKAWVVALAFLTGGPLAMLFGLLEGLALSLTTIAGVIVIPVYVEVSQEIEAARQRSQALLTELQQAHQLLQDYAGQVEELAAIEARNRLARELHDTVSQLLFSIVLTTRSAQLLLEKDPQRLPGLLDQLKSMTGDALSQLRTLITQLRPPQPL